MILVGRTQDNDESTLGITIFEADAESAARKIMEDDPPASRVEIFVFTFVEAGSYPCQCSLDGTLTGTVTVSP